MNWEIDNHDIELVVVPPQGEKCVVDWTDGVRSDWLDSRETDLIEADPAVLTLHNCEYDNDLARADCVTICHLQDAKEATE